MDQHVYSLYNKKVGCYNAPIFSNDDIEHIKAGFTRYCILNKEEAKKSHFDECDLYDLGLFNDLQGSFTLADKPLYVCSFDSLFLEDSK